MNCGQRGEGRDVQTWWRILRIEDLCRQNTELQGEWQNNKGTPPYPKIYLNFYNCKQFTLESFSKNRCSFITLVTLSCMQACIQAINPPYKCLHEKVNGNLLGQSFLTLTVINLGSTTDVPYFCCRRKINWLDQKKQLIPSWMMMIKWPFLSFWITLSLKR